MLRCKFVCAGISEFFAHVYRALHINFYMLHVYIFVHVHVCIQRCVVNAFLQEAYIADLDSKSGASLKLTVLNKKGRIWTMVAGGGASVIYAYVEHYFLCLFCR